MSDVALQTEEVEAMPAKLEYRPCEVLDVNFILNSWLKSYQPSAPPARDYWASQQALIAKLAEHAKVILVCDAENPSFIIGYICGETVQSEFRVHYIYVKNSYRRQGVARSLLVALGWTPGTPIIASHWTRACSPNAAKYMLSRDDYVLKEGNHV